MTGIEYTLLSHDPWGLLAQIGAFQRRRRDVRVEGRLCFPEVRVALFTAREGQRGARRALERDAAAFGERFASFVVRGGGESLPVSLVEALAGRRLTMASAESCSGGAIADGVTMVPGSSRVFLAGIVSYANEAKEGLLGVRRRSLEARGAVSGAVVREMLEGVLDRTGADCAAATSGIAGPTGATALKPVGLVCYGAAWPGGLAVRKGGSRPCRARRSSGSPRLWR